MAVGDNAQLAGFSYMALGRETTYGTGVTATAGLRFLSASLKTMRESQVLEQIDGGQRTYSQRVSLGKTVEGDIEFYPAVDNTASVYLLQSAFGGAITSATSTGDTAGGTAITHTLDIGSFPTYSSLSINHRKGNSSIGEIFEYTGLRVGELTLSAEVGDVLKSSVSMMGKDSTITTNSLETATSNPTQSALTFVNGRLSVETALSSLTTTSFWHIQSFEFGINNNLKSDNEARRIGSDTLVVLPQGIAQFTLNCTIRFDTTTAFDAMINGTQLAAELEFLGDTISGSNLRQSIKITMPKVYIEDAGDPEIGGPDEVLTSEVVFQVLRDDSSSTGYAVRASLRNAVSSYT